MQSFNLYKITNKEIYKEELKKNFSHKWYSADKTQSKTKSHCMRIGIVLKAPKRIVQSFKSYHRSETETLGRIFSRNPLKYGIYGRGLTAFN